MSTSALRLPRWRPQKLDRNHWLGSTLLAVAAGLYLFAGISVTSVASRDGAAMARTRPLQMQAVTQTPPAPEPLQFKAVDPSDAVAFNASIPLSTLPNPAARAFAFRGGEQDRSRSLACLTAAVYYEAATEGADGQRAVAQVVLNRVRHPAFPKSVCGVVFEGSERATGCQFTFTCDGSLARAPHPAFWERARKVAEAALAGKVYAPVGWATHYHTNWVVPYWSASLVKAANVGTHIFYRWEDGWGRPAAFGSRHAGTEPLLAKMSYLGFGAPAEEALTPEEQVLLAGAETPPADLADRKVVRQFVPARREDVAAVLAAQTPEGQKVPDSLRWALTGAGGNEATALGTPAKPAS